LIQVLRIRVQHLNGSNVISSVRLPIKLSFSSKEEMEQDRKRREVKLQWKLDQKYKDDTPKASVLYDYKEIIIE